MIEILHRLQLGGSFKTPARELFRFHIHHGIWGQGAFPVEQRVWSKNLLNTRARLEPLHTHGHMSPIAYDPEGVLQATRLHVCEEFSRTTWRGCSRVFPPLMLLIKPHAYSSAWSLSLKPRGGRAVLYFTHTVYEHVSVLAVSCLTGAAAVRLM